MVIMVVDSTVFIQFFRNNQQAKEFLLGSSDTLFVCRVTLMEIAAGLKSKTAVLMAEKQIKDLGIETIEINEEISVLAGELFNRYHRTHGIGLIDSFIGATARLRDRKLVTHNTKHFKFIRGLDLIVPY